MALISSFALQVVKNNTQVVAQALNLDKKTVAGLTGFIRDNTKEHWKPMVYIGAGIALIAGARSGYNYYVDWKEQQELAPRAGLVDNLLVVDIAEESIQQVAGVMCDLTTEVEPVILEEEIEDVLEFDSTELSKMLNQTDCSKQRLSVKKNKVPVALKSLVCKARLAFPNPNGTRLQHQAMSMFLYKECRKLNMRHADMSKLIPRAVALAQVPSTTQVDMAQLLELPEVKLRYLKINGKRLSPNWSSKLFTAVTSFVSK